MVQSGNTLDSAILKELVVTVLATLKREILRTTLWHQHEKQSTPHWEDAPKPTYAQGRQEVCAAIQMACERLMTTSPDSPSDILWVLDQLTTFRFQDLGEGVLTEEEIVSGNLSKVLDKPPVPGV